MKFIYSSHHHLILLLCCSFLSIMIMHSLSAYQMWQITHYLQVKSSFIEKSLTTNNDDIKSNRNNNNNGVIDYNNDYHQLWTSSLISALKGYNLYYEGTTGIKSWSCNYMGVLKVNSQDMQHVFVTVVLGSQSHPWLRYRPLENHTFFCKHYSKFACPSVTKMMFGKWNMEID